MGLSGAENKKLKIVKKWTKELDSVLNLPTDEVGEFD